MLLTLITPERMLENDCTLLPDRSKQSTPSFVWARDHSETAGECGRAATVILDPGGSDE